MNDEERTATTYRIPPSYWIAQCRAELAAARDRNTQPTADRPDRNEDQP